MNKAYDPINPAGSRPTDSTEATGQTTDATGLNRFGTGAELSSIGGSLSVLLAIVGSGMQGYANGTIDSFFAAFIFHIVGFLLVSLVFPRGRAELRAFLLTYGVCVFVGGLAQCYSLVVFHDPQSTIDAVHTFFPSISSQPPFTTMADIHPLFNAPLAVLIWQQVYAATWWLEFKFGPYTGVMFNAMVVGLAGAITVRTARELFGHDAWRLRRVGTLFATCGLFILFGSVFLRDCFMIFFNVLVIWGIVRWLCRPTSINLIFAGVLTGISVGAMAYLRFESIVLFGLFWFLAFLFWFRKRRLNTVRLFAAAMVLIVLIFASSYLMNYIKISQGFRFDATVGYVVSAAKSSREDSIAMQMIIHQPMPIRLVLGSGSMMIFPMPLWGYFKSGANDYGLIKGYHGIYQVLMLPLVFAGFIVIILAFLKDRKQFTPLLFLAIYMLMNVLIVVATSLEQRHLAQFMPAMMILAAVPDTREKGMRKSVLEIATGWFVVVVLVHLAWAIATIGR